MRADGFYWVCMDQEWEVANFEFGVWWVCGADLPYKDDRFDEIGSKVER